MRSRVLVIITVLLVAGLIGATVRKSAIPSFVEITARLQLEREDSNGYLDNYSSHVFVTFAPRNITSNNTILVNHYSSQNQTTDVYWLIVIVFGGTSRIFEIEPKPEWPGMYNSTISYSFPMVPGEVRLDVIVYSIHGNAAKSLRAFSETISVY